MKRLLLIWICLFAGLLARAQISPVGSPHIPVVLVEFKDVKFSLEDPAAKVDSLLNSRMALYFSENSHGLSNPVFDVYGPVLLDAPMRDYGRDVIVAGERIGDVAPEKALQEAFSILDDEVDFSLYDCDGDGVLDLSVFYYAGFDQAEGGPSDAIWSHHADIRDCGEEEEACVILDGSLRIGYYFCSSELRGNSGAQIIGIGKSVHEMCHALGLPDFYDTNGGKDGVAGGLYQFSVMSNGMYNDGGDTPPYLNSLELILLGWMEWESLVPLEEGWLELSPVQNRVAAIGATATEGEFFLYEFRSGEGWDAPLPPGLVAYHVDMTDISRWENWRERNDINCIGSHPCFYIIPPMAPWDLDYASAINSGTMVFPGVGQVRGFSPVGWDKEPTGLQLCCIDCFGGMARMRVVEHSGSLLSGLVTDFEGAPILNATVVVTKDGEEVASDRSDMNGCYLIPLEEGTDGDLEINVTKLGRRPVKDKFHLAPDESRCTYYRMFADEKPSLVKLGKFDITKGAGYYPSEEPMIGAVRFTMQELSPYAGGRLSKVFIFPFVSSPQTAGPLYVTVDAGGKRVLSQMIEDVTLGEYTPVEISLEEADIRISEGMDFYVGYGFEEEGENHPMSAVYPGGDGNSYYTAFDLEKSAWKPMFIQKGGFYMDLMLEVELAEVPADNLADMGYSYIDIRQGPFSDGEIINLQVVRSGGQEPQQVYWTLDGVQVNTPTLKLEAGEHTLKVSLMYEGGRSEQLQTQLLVY